MGIKIRRFRSCMFAGCNSGHSRPWDMDARTVDVTITSLKNQDITLTARQGIEDITAPAGILKSMPQNDKTNCEIHLTEGQPVQLHLKLGHNKPMDWVIKYEATL